MANSPTHRFGQIIGDLLEQATVETVRPIAQKHHMYLDFIHPRPTRDGKRKIHVEDILGNFHDLDLVVEEGGSEEVIGRPRAFIEVAWRRYTKHSKNKAQEISSAVLSCARKYADDAPFTGTVLAGEFTENSLQQLRSQGFVVVHFSLQSIVDAFKTVGIDAYWEEDTPDEKIEEQVKRFDLLTDLEIETIKHCLFQEEKESFEIFAKVLDQSLDRHVSNVSITSLWGSNKSFETIQDARDYIESMNLDASDGYDFIRFEIRIEYSNGSRTTMEFTDRYDALRKLALMDND
ncbi:DNA methylase N-4/N-6 domain-containing protein [Bifidobacterium samirii]|uniref:DNA methylase N-4/N-6 domain-containing protein n=2 Tax=Bifidobacterium samirii TaxID=2306974 RepID=A0A430FJB5_9BIFI|nr:DNA methylase N-4/N-6 domain-containing protein [Bifidobacterium samirii]